MAANQSYRHLAACYNSSRFEGPAGQFNFESDRRIVLDAITIAKPERVIDVPVGTGRVLEYLSPLPIDVVGVDYTEEMLDIARDTITSARHSVLQGDATNLSFEDGEFDLLISLRFFHLFARSQRPQFTKEFSRAVKPGGFALVSFTNGWYGGGLNWLLNRLGHKTVQFEHVGELGLLFPGWRVCRVYGNFLPKQWVCDSIPGLGPLLRKGVFRWPLNRICWERFYLLQKP